MFSVHRAKIIMKLKTFIPRPFIERNLVWKREGKTAI
jgi:hypothetical protein